MKRRTLLHRIVDLLRCRVAEEAGIKMKPLQTWDGGKALGVQDEERDEESDYDTEEERDDLC